MTALSHDNIHDFVSQVANDTPVFDIHTHLYSARFGQLLLYGIDELLTYHYLIAEVFRAAPMPYDRFWAMSKQQQADYVFEHLFIRHSPVSEACRGVLTVLQAFGLEVNKRDLPAIRKHLAGIPAEAYIDKVFQLANVRSVVMTNDPFDDAERRVWETGGETDSRFQSALRIDPLLNDWESAARRLCQLGYGASGDLGLADLDAVKRFLDDWIGRMRPRYMAVSLPQDFTFPEETTRAHLVEHAILPVAREANIPFAMMIGVRRQINPQLRLAGDGVGPSDIQAVSNLCARFPENRFLVTTLSRQDQHELCVAARKHPNLCIFGCWWFLNNPSIIEEMTRQRFELLGMSHVPQHSDARVLDQIIYKWSHSRRIIADVLADKYKDVLQTGWVPTREEVHRDIMDLFGHTFERFCKGSDSGE